MPSAWFQRLRPRPRASRRIYCFPYAGGSVAVYSPLAARLRSDCEAWVASLPGRGPRAAEPLETELPALVRPLASALEEEPVSGSVFLGHSMGALLAFEVVRELRRRGRAAPSALIASGARAPHRFTAHGRQRHRLPAPALLDHLRELGGVPDEVLRSPELLELLLPIVRADLAACDGYRYAAEPPLDVPLLVLRGDEDAEAAGEEVSGWTVQTTGPCAFRSFTGGHFYLHRHWAALAALAEAALPRDGGSPVHPHEESPWKIRT